MEDIFSDNLEHDNQPFDIIKNSINKFIQKHTFNLKDIQLAVNCKCNQKRRDIQNFNNNIYKEAPTLDEYINMFINWIGYSLLKSSFSALMDENNIVDFNNYDDILCMRTIRESLVANGDISKFENQIQNKFIDDDDIKEFDYIKENQMELQEKEESCNQSNKSNKKKPYKSPKNKNIKGIKTEVKSNRKKGLPRKSSIKSPKLHNNETIPYKLRERKPKKLICDRDNLTNKNKNKYPNCKTPTKKRNVHIIRDTYINKRGRKKKYDVLDDVIYLE